MDRFGQFFVKNFETKTNPIFNSIALLYLISSETGLIIMTANNINGYMIAQAVLIYIECFLIYLFIIIENKQAINIDSEQHNCMYSFTLLKLRDAVQANKPFYNRL